MADHVANVFVQRLSVACAFLPASFHDLSLWLNSHGRILCVVINLSICSWPPVSKRCGPHMCGTIGAPESSTSTYFSVSYVVCPLNPLSLPSIRNRKGLSG